jgi:hypothetical protein
MPTNHELILGTLASGEEVPLLQADRRRHVYAIGMTGTGKTGLLLNMMHADLLSGAGFCFLDPHGDASQHIASLAPAGRRHDVIYLDPSDATHTFAYNPLSGVPEPERATVAANIVSAFKSIWSQSWGPRLEYILGHSLRLLLDARDQTLLGLPRLLVDESYREWLIARCADPVVRSFWQLEYAGYDTRLRSEAIAPIQNKIGAFLANPFIRSILCQNASTLDVADVMNRGKVLIVNLSKGNLGTEPAHLLGALLITACAQAAEGRRRIPEQERRDFTLYVDEFQNFATDSFSVILSESRKWRFALVAANQTISQLPDGLQHAIFGNVGTLIVFRVGSLDAKRLAGELGLPNAATLAQTSNYRAWVKLMRHGSPIDPCLVETFAPPFPGLRFEQVVAFTRSRHMMRRHAVEERIAASFPKPPEKKVRYRSKRDADRG